VSSWDGADAASVVKFAYFSLLNEIGVSTAQWKVFAKENDIGKIESANLSNETLPGYYKTLMLIVLK
jgi:hypothetical protein